MILASERHVLSQTHCIWISHVKRSFAHVCDPSTSLFFYFYPNSIFERIIFLLLRSHALVRNSFWFLLLSTIRSCEHPLWLLLIMRSCWDKLFNKLGHSELRLDFSLQYCFSLGIYIYFAKKGLAISLMSCKKCTDANKQEHREKYSLMSNRAFYFLPKILKTSKTLSDWRKIDKLGQGYWV